MASSAATSVRAAAALPLRAAPTARVKRRSTTETPLSRACGAGNDAAPAQSPKEQLENPVWHIHSGHPPAAELPITFALLLNLVSASNAEDKSVLWGFIRRHAPDATPERYPILDHLAGYAVAYYRDFVRPQKRYRTATPKERAALEVLVFTTAIANLVREGKTHQLPGMIQVGKKLGNQPLDDADLGDGAFLTDVAIVNSQLRATIDDQDNYTRFALVLEPKGAAPMDRAPRLNAR